jgi:hypothetical protein
MVGDQFSQLRSKPREPIIDGARDASCSELRT